MSYKDVDIKFSPGAHRYTVNGQHKVGVTTVLNVLNKPALMTWPMYEANKYIKKHSTEKGEFLTISKTHLEDSLKAFRMKSDKAANMGTKIHEAIEMYLTGHPSVDDGKVGKALESFKNWYENLNGKAIEVERVVYSKQGDYAGTFDCLLELDGKKVLCDVKTTKKGKKFRDGIYPEYFIQLGAYSMAYKEETGEEIDDLMIINVSKSGAGITTKTASQLGLSIGELEQSFAYCLRLYRTLDKIAFKLGGK